MSKKKKVVLGFSTILVVLVVVFLVVPWFIWQHDKDEGEKANQKYGFITSVEDVTPTGMTLIVECQKQYFSVSLPDGPQLLEKATIWGWKDVDCVNEVFGVLAMEHVISRGAQIKFDCNWEYNYGKLSKGTYRVRMPVKSDEGIDGWLYATFEIKE